MGSSTSQVPCFAGALTTTAPTELELMILKIFKVKHARAAGALGGRGRASGACIGGEHRAWHWRRRRTIYGRFNVPPQFIIPPLREREHVPPPLYPLAGSTVSGRCTPPPLVPPHREREHVPPPTRVKSYPHPTPLEAYRYPPLQERGSPRRITMYRLLNLLSKLPRWKHPSVTPRREQPIVPPSHLYPPPSGCTPYPGAGATKCTPSAGAARCTPPSHSVPPLQAVPPTPEQERHRVH